MKIAVLSDIHDHISNLENVLKQIKKEAEAIIFCGDLISPFTTSILAKANISTYACLGNNDEDHIGMLKKGGEKFTWFHLSEEYGEVKLDNRKIAFCHYPRLAELLAKSGEYDVVFYGHTHIAKNDLIDKTLLVNPGAVCGIDFQKKGYSKATYALYNTKTNSAEIIEIK
jgi:putative phosphoesterase